MYLRGFFCLIFIFIASAVGQFCFRNRVPAGQWGQCQDPIRNIDTTEKCCQAGGEGWTNKANGKRCRAACLNNDPPAVVQPVQPEQPNPQPNQPQQTAGEVKFCFRTRKPNGRFGFCENLIGEHKQDDCCRQGGKGWTDKENGKRCEDVCQGVVDDRSVQHCFRRRTNRGRSKQFLGQKTRLHCCQEGGNGWSANANGQDCDHPCKLSPPPAIHGEWSEWSNWGQCSVTCQEGIQTRRRTCDIPPSAHGGNSCEGPPLEQRVCKERPCPINGGWGNWQDAGECSATCYHEGQTIYRQWKRECDNPRPQFGGRQCQGPALKNERCTDLPHCPVDGGWSRYGAWSLCSQTCGDGIQIRRRTCTNPRPEFEGRDCEGPDGERKICRNRCICDSEGSGSDSGDGEAETVDHVYWPCDDEDSCNPSPQRVDEGGGSLSYSLDVPTDVEPDSSYSYI